MRSRSVLPVIRLTVLLAIFSLEVTRAAPSQQPEEIVFGVLPIISTEKLVARFAPLADYLSAATGVRVRLETAPDFRSFLQRTAEKRYDLIFTAPHFYYLAQRQSGYRVIVRIDAPDMRAVIVTRHNSPIRDLQDLKGKKLSITDPLALATLLVRNHLRLAGIDPDMDLTLVTTPNHSASLLSAQIGTSDAAGLMLPPYKRSRPEVQAEMKILATTEGSPHMPIAVAASLDAPLVSRLQTALVQLKDRQEATTILAPMQWPGFVEVRPEVYDRLSWAAEQMR